MQFSLVAFQVAVTGHGRHHNRSIQYCNISCSEAKTEPNTTVLLSTQVCADVVPSFSADCVTLEHGLLPAKGHSSRAQHE